MVMGKRHILVIPYPAQGHVIPLMELSQRLIKEGFRITFVNTDFNHKRIVNAFPLDVDADDRIHLVSIPDGLGVGEDRNHLGNLTEAISTVIPGKLKELIQKINESNDDKITCVLADLGMRWALEVAEEMGIQKAAFWPASASLLATNFRVQKLIDDGVIGEDGTPIKQELNQFSPPTPAMNPKNFAWVCMGNAISQRFFIELMHQLNKTAEIIDWLICNSAYALEPAAFTLAPNIQPIGPLSINHLPGNLATNFWPEDATCLKWLDQQPPRSVIYIAFGSFTVFDQTQFQELALGLELSNKPFLWVVRPDITEEIHGSYPEGFQDRVVGRSQMVGWAPQQKVLGHNSIACFVSHCGWNSTLEGLSNGVPFLCWPYFADQFTNESYICDVWKVGLRFEKDERGIITREEIKSKVEQLLGDESFKGRSHELKEVAHNSVKEGGLSEQNLQNFTKWLKH